MDFEFINTIWLNIVKRKRSGPVLYLFFSTPRPCIANIVKVPTRDTGEVEDNLIAGLMGSIETRSVSGATYGVVTEASGVREARFVVQRSLTTLCWRPRGTLQYTEGGERDVLDFHNEQNNRHFHNRN